MRNLEKDEIEMGERRELMLRTGFRIFAEKGIETVSMQEVANACGLGVATLYRYFSTKLEFVIEIGKRKWEEYFEEIETEYARVGGEAMNAAQELDYYLSSYIRLYSEHGDILRFNQNFNIYIAHEKTTKEQLQSYLESVDLFRKKFHVLYEKGRKDGTIRTEESEQTMFNTTMHIMMAVCSRFAQGVLVGEEEHNVDLTKELMILKQMIMTQYCRI